MSTLKPQFDANNIRLIGVGLEEVGVEEFVRGEFFKGELYIDTKKECYKKLGFRRLGFLDLFRVLFSRKSKEEMAKAREAKLGGNLMEGDGMQNGGVLVVDQGGKALFTFKQEEPSDKADLNDVLKSLGLPPTEANVSKPEEGATCNP